MTATFADTYFWLALVTPNDRAHARAHYVIDHLSAPLTTTTWVLTEVGDALCKPRTRSVFTTLLDSIDQHRLISVLPAEQNHFNRAVALYRSRPDKEWSLTDCTSFVMMRDLHITEALTGDHHFEQAGFVALLK
jgi:predicted nucleic acid-binding protein